jgi:hypothetical protein
MGSLLLLRVSESAYEEIKAALLRAEAPERVIRAPQPHHEGLYMMDLVLVKEHNADAG